MPTTLAIRCLSEKLVHLKLFIEPANYSILTFLVPRNYSLNSLTTASKVNLYTVEEAPPRGGTITRPHALVPPAARAGEQVRVSSETTSSLRRSSEYAVEAVVLVAPHLTFNGRRTVWFNDIPSPQKADAELTEVARRIMEPHQKDAARTACAEGKPAHSPKRGNRPFAISTPSPQWPRCNEDHEHVHTSNAAGAVPEPLLLPVSCTTITTTRGTDRQ